MREKIIEDVVSNLLCFLLDNYECQPLDERQLQEVGSKFLKSKYNQTKIDGHDSTYNARCFVQEHSAFIDETPFVEPEEAPATALSLTAAVQHIIKISEENEILTLAALSFEKDAKMFKEVLEAHQEEHGLSR